MKKLVHVEKTPHAQDNITGVAVAAARFGFLKLAGSKRRAATLAESLQVALETYPSFEKVLSCAQEHFDKLEQGKKIAVVRETFSKKQRVEQSEAEWAADWIVDFYEKTFEALGEKS